MSILKKATLATALAATTLATASPAMAQDYYGHRRGGDSTGAAIAGGIIGLALGAIIVSSANNNRHDRYASRGWQYRDGYYWDRQGHRYDRNGRRCDEDDMRGRDSRGYYDRRGYDDRGYGRDDRGYYGRGDYYGQQNYRYGY